MNSSIGFFLHSPWPPTDIFKMLPYRMEILKSLLCCDLIGFHIFEYARNFYNGCQRMLGFKQEFKKGGTIEIECNGRTIQLRISHIGVDVDELKSILSNKESASFQKIRVIETKNPDKKTIIFGSYDRNHTISGIRTKLNAFLAFLDAYPYSRNKVCLVQYVNKNQCPDCLRIDCKHIIEYRMDIDSIVQTIKAKYKGSLIYEE